MPHVPNTSAHDDAQACQVTLARADATALG
jgi:hypothetical protein